MRTCVGCRTTRPVADLVRVARSREGSVGVGRTLPGRGAWLCRDSPACLDRAVHQGGFNRSLRASLSASDLGSIRDALSADRGS
jgi:predicted RNA-binding protein YlxR (DUF448 family)